MVPASSSRISPVPDYSGSWLGLFRFNVRGCHPLRRNFPVGFHYPKSASSPVLNPAGTVIPTVWAPPLSLTTTHGITVVLLSCRYLDVSVPCVRLRLWRMTGLQPAGLPHSDIRGSNGHLHLPAAFRSLSRPSSPPRAKASALRPYPLSSHSLATARLRPSGLHQTVCDDSIYYLSLCQRTLPCHYGMDVWRISESNR